jgi:hypothetical protein
MQKIRSFAFATVAPPTPETVNFRRTCRVGSLSTGSVVADPKFLFGLVARICVSAEGPNVSAELDVVTVKLFTLVAVPADAMTEIGPLDAPAGTMAVIRLAETTVKFPAPTLAPLNVTSVTPVKFAPSIATDVPTTPDVGENPEMDGPEPVPDETVHVKLAKPVAPRLSVAEIVTLKLPAVVVVPLMRPVPASTPSPGGRPVAP